METTKGERDRCSVFAALVLSLMAAEYAFAQSPPAWRFWQVSDGLKESYTVSIGVDPQGQVWARHGVVDVVSVLNGYGVVSIPAPTQPGTLRIAPDGAVWALDPGGLRQYRDRQWILATPPEVSELPVGRRASVHLVPVDRDRVLLAFQDHIIEYNAAAHTSTLVKKAADTELGGFSDAVAARDGGVWITGDYGIAKLGQASATNGGVRTWREHNVAGLEVKGLSQPSEGENGELLVTASSVRDGKNALLELNKGRWRTIIAGVSGSLRGWRDSENLLWIQQGNVLFRLVGGRKEPVERNETLSGIPFEVARAREGFWLSTSQGLARYAPALWRTPKAASGIEQLVHGITEDKKGRIWFASTTALARLDKDQWKIYPFPPGDTAHTHSTGSLWSLPDGRLTLPFNERPGLLVFDPEREKFEELSHPSGRQIISVSPRRDGTFWTFTVDRNNTGGSALEIFDGETFRLVTELQPEWGLDAPRYVYETRSGDVWIGGIGGLGVYRAGKFTSFGPKEGYTGSGGFAIHELPNGRVLVGGRENLLEFDGKSWTLVAAALDRVRCIMQSRDGTLWVASGTGVHRFRNGVWVTNTTEDGLPSTASYNVFEDSRGRIWAGTTSGLSLYHPEADRDPPRTVIPEEKNLRETPPGGEVRLVFSGMDKWKFTSPDRLLFSHRLDGGAWSRFGPSTFISYKRLPPGRHRFEARAMDRNLNIDPTPASFEFVVLSPWYAQTGPLVIAGLGLATIIGLMLLTVAHFRQLRQAKQAAEDARQATETANSFLRTLIECLPEPIYAKDDQGRFLLANSSVVKMMGAPAVSDLLGKTDFDFYPKGLAAKYHADEQRIFQTGEPLVDLEEPGVDPEGNPTWKLTTKVPFHDGSGKIIGLVGLGRDITERKRMVQDLEHNAEKLARSNAELERFAYVASHDLQEPLRMVASFTQLLSQRYSGKLDETADRYINFAVDGAKRMQQLIVDLLAYSRVNSKELDLRQTECEAVVQTALQNLSAAIEESGAVIERDPLPVLMADAAQLGQLFQNLIGNAIKFRGQASPRIRIAATNSGPDWRFSVQDNGIGIDPRHSGRIFQIFQRLHTRAEYPGTGIGLAVCQKVVERHGGKIWVESEPGVGSAFRFTIPKSARME